MALLNDPDPTMRSMAEEEYATLSQSINALVENTFPSLLVPPSKTAKLSAIIELRAGVGGSESALFTADLVRMYTRAAQEMGWDVSLISSNILEAGGMKDAIMEVKGQGAYDALRWESGVHRVQRVPATEANGRVHTSTVSVMVRCGVGGHEGPPEAAYRSCPSLKRRKQHRRTTICSR